jgi:Fe-S oxidoreductase
MRTFHAEITDWVEYNLKNCIGVDECMKVCPVVDPDIPIKELNEATRPGTPVPERIARFAAECIQCGRCDTVCPTAAGRSIMMLYLKAKLARANKQPRAYKKYLSMRGYDKNPLLLGASNLFGRLGIRRLAKHVDKKTFKRAPLLIYLGCYIFTKTKSAVQLVDVAEKLGLEYEVLGGLRSCCGWPRLLAGALGPADDYHEHLLGLIEKSSPEEVVTGCAECFASLVKIKRKYKAGFEPLTPSMWLLKHADILGLEHSGETVTYHDSCHLSRKLHYDRPVRELLVKVADLVEMERSGPRDTYCCGYWAMKANPGQLKDIHRDRFDEARKTGAGKMMVECVTCLESFDLHPEEGVRVQDVLELVIDNSRLMREER